jgi:circadian clock protein KaiB
MAKNRKNNVDIENFLKPDFDEKIMLRLYITGAAVKSMMAIENIKSICEKYIKGRYELEVIDIYRQPDVAVKDQIVAVPTLIRTTGDNKTRLIGDMSDKSKIMKLLGINYNLNGEAGK